MEIQVAQELITNMTATIEEDKATIADLQKQLYSAREQIERLEQRCDMNMVMAANEVSKMAAAEFGRKQLDIGAVPFGTSVAEAYLAARKGILKGFHPSGVTLRGTAFAPPDVE